MLGATRQCTECGAALRGAAGLGLCPACSVRGALELARVGETAESDPRGLRRGMAGDYELLDEIARGGMGVVYRARQRSLGRIVALKVLLGGTFAGPEGRRRLRAEAAAAAQLVHPNIVAVHEVGEIDGQPFYSMEFVDGRTLADRVRGGAMPAGRAARYLAAIAEAVQHAHDKGVLHRDLKPSNVLVDASDRPRITDFGLAKPFDRTRAFPGGVGGEVFDGGLTLTGQVLGSPAYMAPEQAFGDSDRLGPAVDVYALGSILYELLVARPPFQGPTPQAILDQVRAVDPVAPRRLDATVPVDLETICLKCLEKEPARRYARAGELAEDLHRFLDGRAVRARPVGALGRLVRWARRHPLVAGLAGALALTLATAMGFAVAGAERIRESRDAARERLADALVAEARASRLAAEPGYREHVLERIEEARQLDRTGRLAPRLRQEAIAALARSDVRRVTAERLPSGWDMMLMRFDSRFELCALEDPVRGGIRVHRVADGALVRHLAGRPPDEVAAFDPASRFLAVRHGGALALWEVASGRCLLSEDGGEGTGYVSGAFHPDGTRFGRGERGARFVIYELPSGAVGELVRRAEWPLPGGRPAGAVAWSPDGTAVAMTQADDWLAVCEAATGEVRWEIRRTDGVTALAWVPGREALAVLTGRDSVVLVGAGDGTVIGPAGVPGDSAECLAISPDGDRLAVGTERFGARIFDLGAARPLGSDPRGAWHLHFDAEGRRLGTLNDRGHPAWLELLPSPVLRSFETGASSAESVVRFSSDGGRLLVLGGEGAQVWDVQEGRRRGLAPARHGVGAAWDGGASRVYVTHDGTLEGFHLGAGGGTDRGDGRVVGEPLVVGRRFWGVAAAPGRGWLALADHGGGTLLVLDAASRQPIHELTPFLFPAYVDFSPDERWLACGGGTNVAVWDLEHPGEPVRRFSGVGEVVRFSPDGRWLMALGRTLSMWRTGSWKPGPPLPLADSNSHNWAGAISPDGRWLAATQADREVHLVDLPTGRTLAVLDGPGESRVVNLVFGPDGRRLAAARERGEVQVWDLVALQAELGRRHLGW